MANITRTFNTPSNPAHIRPHKEAEAIAQLGVDLDALVAGFNATDTDVTEIEAAYENFSERIPLSAFREVDANGDLGGILGAQAGATLNLTTDIVLTGVEYSSYLNGLDVTTQVLAAAANPTDTVLVDVTIVDNDVTIQVTPNDGTNNGATPVGLTTAQLVLVINGNVSAAYDGINVTVTDASSILPLFTATGGDATALADSGEGDGISASFWGGRVSNGGILSYYSTPQFMSNSYGSDGDNAWIIRWAASNNDPIQVSIGLPHDLDVSKDLKIQYRVVSGGTTDAVGFLSEAWFNEGDTKVADTGGTNQTTTYAEKEITIAAADIPDGAQTLTVTLVPAAHTTDTMTISSVRLNGYRAVTHA